MTESQRPRICIVGGGPGGLMTAYFLQQRVNTLVEVSILEASGRLGGKIVTDRFQRVPANYEAGAAEFYDYSVVDEDPLKQLIAELGLSISPMGGHSVFWRERWIANLDDYEQVAGTEQRRRLEAFHRYARDRITPCEFFRHGGEESVGVGSPGESFVHELDRAPGAADGMRHFVETMIHSDLATETKSTSVAYGLQNYLMNDPAYMRLYGIDGGNQRLPEALAARIAATVQLRRQVATVGRGPNGTLMVGSCASNGDLYQEPFDAVVLALPLDALRQIAFQGEKLATAMQMHRAHYDHPAHYLRVTIAFERPFWRGRMLESYCQLDRWGGCCLYDESSRWPDSRYGILGWLLGGEAAESMARLDDESLVQQMLDSLPPELREGRTLFLEGRVQRWIGAVNAIPGGWTTRSLDQRHQPEPSEHAGLFVVGDYLFDSTLNGVLDSADYVADWLAANWNETASGRKKGRLV